MILASPTEITHTVAIAQVTQVLQGATLQGLDTQRFLERAGIPPALLHVPKARVSQAQYARLIRVLKREMRDELWGLCNQPLPVGSFAHICRSIIHSKQLGEAIQAGIKAFRLLHQDLAPRFIVNHDIACIQVPYPKQSSAALDYGIRTFCFFAYGLMSWLVARPVPLLCLAYPRHYKNSHTEAGSLFKTKVRYEEQIASIEIEKKWLDLPIVQTPNSLEDFIKELPGNLLIRYRNQATTTERVRRLLKKQQHHNNMPDLTEISCSLGMSAPTLRRHLSLEGVNFQTIKDAVRRDLAISYLQTSHLNINDIAIQLGFSEPSTFHRAFKSWTGVTPGFYRFKHPSDPL